MVGNVGAQVALLAFAVAIMAGLQAGNGVVTILTRAIVCMFVASFVGQVVAWMAKLVLRDVFQARKIKMDQAHVEALEAIEAMQAQSIPAAQPADAESEDLSDFDAEPRLAKAS